MSELFFSAEFLPATAGAILFGAAAAAARKHLLRSTTKGSVAGRSQK